MKKLCAIFIFLFFPSVVFAIEDCQCEHHHHENISVEVKNGSTLTIKECIALGIKNSPVLKEYAHKLEIAKSNVGLAKSAYFPELGVGIGYKQEFNSNRIDFYRNYRELPSVGVSLNKMIWDFGKTTANIKMEEFLKIAAEYEFEDATCSTVFDIKRHYYALLKAKANYEAEKLNYDIQTQLVKNIQNMVKSGGKNQADLINAQILKLKIKTDLNKAEDEYLNAKEALNNAMYLENAPNYDIYETQTFSYIPQKQNAIKNISYTKHANIKKDDTIFSYQKFSYNSAVEKAYKNSPDIKALVATRNSFEQALIMVKRNYYPELNAGVGYDFLKTNVFDNNNGLSIAVTVDSKINAMRQKYDVKGANAQLALADTEIETFKKNLYFVVRKCLNTVDTAYKNLPIYKEKMVTSSQYFDATYSNYENNISNQLDLEYAKMTYIKSIKDYINAEFDYNIALINLEMAMHEHLIDYHDDAEHTAEYHEGNENEVLSKLIKCGKKHKH